MKNTILVLFILFLITQSCQKKTASEEQKTVSNQPVKTVKNIIHEPDISDMLLIKGGKIKIGSEDGLPNEQPVFETELNDFYIDLHPVTVVQFRKFIEETGFQTEADKFGDAGLFDFENKVWKLKKGANWEYPEGKEKAKAMDDHPVTQVSWRDAKAYCQWAGKRLPTETEWEYAARNGQNTEDIYSWGNKLIHDDGTYQANTWQGSFPEYNKVEDGYKLTAPVGEFAKNKLGLQDMGGNVWEWCADTYRLYEGNNQPFTVVDSVKVQRGGSFMCDPKVCHGFRVSGRAYSSWETSLFHVGFRCALDVKREE